MQKQENFYQRVRNYIRKNQMISAGDVVVAGISGGGDSVAMLSMLRRYREEVPFSLYAVHVHHGIRGAEADRDQAFVEDLCRNWGISCTCYPYDVPELAREWGMGHEEAGRLVRKEAFAKELLLRKEEGTDGKIALAHNQDDAAETLLFNLCRGCGLRGLSAMRPVSGNIIRPVLCLEKKEIADYLEGEKLPFMTDSTNSQEDYTRNRLRKNILPLLAEQVNAEAARHMAGSAGILADACDFLERQSAVLIESTVRWENEEVGNSAGCLLTDEYFQADPALVSFGLMGIFYRVSGRQKDFTQAHVEAVRELAGKQVGRKQNLPYGILAERTYGGIRIFHPQIPAQDVPGNLKMKKFLYKGQKIEEKKYTKWLDCDKIHSDLAFRTRREGDFLVINGAGDKKKLNRYFIDAKIPGALRDQIPLVAEGSEILWVVGYRISEKYKITPQTKNVIELRYEAEGIQQETPSATANKENAAAGEGSIFITKEETHTDE